MTFQRYNSIMMGRNSKAMLALLLYVLKNISIFLVFVFGGAYLFSRAMYPNPLYYFGAAILFLALVFVWEYVSLYFYARKHIDKFEEATETSIKAMFAVLNEKNDPLAR